MKMTCLVTFLAVTVLSLVSGVFNTAAAATSLKKAQAYKANKQVMSADQAGIDSRTDQPVASAVFLVSRNRSLIDFQDGSRTDGMDYQFIPKLQTYFGSFSAKISYSQNLNTEPTTDLKQISDWADVPFTFAFNSAKWLWSPPYQIAVTPTLTLVLPMSQASTKRDQLQTAFVTGISFSLFPDGIATKKDGAFSLALGVTAGRSFHPYEENINGATLNKYSSNQTLNAGYTYKKVSFGVEYIHKTRWTYGGNIRDSFEMSEELGYEINDHLGLALGHTNAGSSLKADGSETNFRVVNENDSTVYVQMGVSF